MQPHAIDLTNPEVVLRVLVHKTGVIFGRRVVTSKIKGSHFAQKYDVKLRPYQAPTCLDEKLAFIMANMAKIKAGDLVYDPFFGSGSTGVAMAHFKAIVVGSDIDLRVLHGTKIGRKTYNQEVLSKMEQAHFDVFTNFTHYGLPRPEVLAMDVVSPGLRRGKYLDAIICDPPYGVRVTSRKQDF